MSRRESLLQIIGQDNNLLLQLVDEVIFLETQLADLKKLPFIRVNPKNPALQKATPASRQYKEMLQQYTNCIKTIARISGQDETEEDSPLRAWVKARNEDAGKESDDLDSG